MKIILSSQQMKDCDSNTITEHGVPSLVLMERAALSVTISILSNFPDASSIAVICGPGNNGGDGVAIARLLHLKGKTVSCTVLGDESKFSDQLKDEINIAKSYGIQIKNHIVVEEIEKYDLVVDAMFGIGLTRGLQGDFLYAANIINENANKVVAVDIPSGFDSDNGKMLGEAAVKADLTITFAYMKKGLVLGDCKSSAGEIQVADVGIYAEPNPKHSIIIDEGILKLIKPRQVDANKGTCGKILIVAGSENIYGACYLSAKSALVSGAGLVKIFTHQNNIASIQQNLPEAMYFGYHDFEAEELKKDLDWADVILVGPGLGTNAASKQIMRLIAKEATVPVVIDADGLNILSQDISDFECLSSRVPVVITPHLKEMERLTKINLKDIKYNIENVALNFANNYNCIVVLKDATTIVATKDATNFIISGNEALATPGSGDVLSGLIASLMAQKVNPSLDVTINAAAYLHGLSGRIAGQKAGVRSVLASDIIEEIKNKI